MLLRLLPNNSATKTNFRTDIKDNILHRRRNRGGGGGGGGVGAGGLGAVGVVGCLQ